MDKVEVVRYIRPIEMLGWRPRNKYEENSNLYGVTVVFELDYENKTVLAKWAICNGDNFEKRLGVKLARESKVSYKFPLNSVSYNDGLVPALMWGLCTELDPVNLEYYNNVDFSNLKSENFSTTLYLFLRANRELTK